jgi:hypothetical protein
MLAYRLIDSHDNRFYICLPELVIYIMRSKETTLISSYSAEIIHIFTLSCKHQLLTFAELVTNCNQDESFSSEFFEQAIEQLLEMNMIESIE